MQLGKFLENIQFNSFSFNQKTKKSWQNLEKQKNRKENHRNSKGTGITAVCREMNLKKGTFDISWGTTNFESWN